MQKHLIVLLLVHSIRFYSQAAYKFPEKFSQTYNHHPELSLKNLTEVKDIEQKEAIESYIVTNVYREQLEFDLNSIYLEWNEPEVYMLKLLDTILSKAYKEKKINLFLKRSIVANAGTSRFGNIYFNIGMFCEAENEAFLATIICHEAAHYFLKHKIKELKLKEDIFSNGSLDRSRLEKYARTFQKYEMQADSFAIASVKKLNLNFSSIVRWNESNDLQENLLLNGRSYKKMRKASSLNTDDLKKKKDAKFYSYQSHPSYLARYDYAKKQLDSCVSCTKNFIIDSAYFFKIKKIAFDERKKISFESYNFNSCLTFSFKDYINGVKTPKNYYYLVESIRRLIYAKPELKDIGFLTEYINDSELGISKSILEKPDYLFSSLEDYEKVKDHPLLTEQKKPFRSYLQAFFYFSYEAITKGLNEANLSMALYYHSVDKRDSVEKYLNKYISNGNCSSMNFAKGLIEQKKITISKGKLLLLYNDLEHYTKNQFNYFLTKKKQSENPKIRMELGQDSLSTKLVILNEFLGNSPTKLNTYQKLISAMNFLYNDDDVEMCKKVKLNSHFANEDKNLSKSFKKHLLILAPEWHLWLEENGLDRIFYVDMIYQYNEYMKGEEYYNDYTGYYLDMNKDRPYFKDSFRSGMVRKKKDQEMYNEMKAFLYE